MVQLSEKDAPDPRDKISGALSLVPEKINIAVNYERAQETVFE